MFLLIDTANLQEIEKALEVLPLAGVTTCPTIITAEHRPLWDILRDIRSLIGEERMLHAQVLGNTAAEILRDAAALRERVSGNFFVKVPVTLEGLKAMPLLKREGIPFTATTIHTAAQALLAAEHGAAFLAPYINHVEDAGISSPELIAQVATLLERRQLPAKILAASFRNTRQVMAVLAAGAHTVTVSPEIIWHLTASRQTDEAVLKFRRAWDNAFGAGKNVADLD